MRGPVRELEVNRIGVLSVAQRKKRATDELTGDGLAGISALGIDHDLRVRRLRTWDHGWRLPRRDAQREIGLQSRKHHMRLTVGDVKIADFHGGFAA